MKLIDLIVNFIMFWLNIAGWFFIIWIVALAIIFVGWANGMRHIHYDIMGSAYNADLNWVVFIAGAVVTFMLLVLETKLAEVLGGFGWFLWLFMTAATVLFPILYSHAFHNGKHFYSPEEIEAAKTAVEVVQAATSAILQ